MDSKILSDCGYAPCPKRPDVDLIHVLFEISKTPNGPHPTIGSNGRTQRDQILKTELLIVQENGLLELDIDNNYDWIAIVAKKLKFIGSNSSKSNFRIEWANFDIRKLNGADGADGPDGSSSGSNGVNGESGRQGGTRNCPFVYLFIGEIEVENGKIDDIDIRFTLNGLPGGRGGNGGNGGNGIDGKKGRNARSATIGCKRGPGNGQDGGDGGYGGRGGNGGCGGDGAIIQVFCLNQSVFSKFSNVYYSVNGGRNGMENFGRAGDPGTPGIGGPRGDIARDCDANGRHRGSDGRPKQGSSEWYRWNLGPGIGGMDGKSGDYLLDMLDDDDVFKDPI